uniref:Retrovirus-related Pol polyprotein from transposon TNT 1-94 n=1 Tax=Tanacetum cinerariifolium TaxID=118510 RepID=A0A6L2JAF1_TANCI|nr:hypothetical protein [Tanacetum cinerariifolium]
MDITIDQQVALYKALVPHASRLRIGKRNFLLRLDITSKESTLQVVYDVLRLTPFYKAFLVTTDATAIVHHHSIRFKMNNKKRIVNLEYFREMLHICPRIPNQTFDELLFEEEILAFLRYLGHSREIKKITDVNINKLHQPWRSFAAVINKNSAAYKEYYAIASGAAPPKTKSSVKKTQSSSNTTITPPTAVGTRLSTLAKGIQPAKSSKAKGANEGTGILPGVPDVPIDESDEEISWKSSDEDDDDDEVDDRSDDEFHDDQDSDTNSDDLVHPKLSTHDEEAKDEESFDPIGQTPSHEEKFDDKGNNDVNLGMNVGGNQGPDAEDDAEELYGDLNINLEGREVQMINVHITQVFEDTHVTLTPVNPDGQQQSSSVSSQFVSNMLNLSPNAGNDSLFESTPRVDVQVTTTVSPLPLIAPTRPPPSIPTISQVQQAPAPKPTTSTLQDLPDFSSLFGFNHRLKNLEANFSEFMQTNQFAGAVSSIPDIVDRYIDHQMNEAIKVAVQIQSDRLRDEAQDENVDFLNKLDENIQNIIKEQVKEQVKVQVSKILPKLKKTVNEQLEAEVLTRSSNSSKSSYVVAADLSELELKKILLKKMESNKSIHRSNEQKNLYKALVDAYECDKIILDTYGDTVTLKRRRDDADKDKESSARSDRGSKRRREGKEPESTSAPKEKASKTTAAADDQPIAEASQHPEWFQKQMKPPTPYHAWNKTLPATYESTQPWISNLAKQADSRTSFNELMDTLVEFLAFLMNRLKVDTLTPELLDGPTYELMKGSCKSLVELKFFLEEVYKATTDQLDWNNPKGQQYPHNLLKPLLLIPNSRGRRVIPFDHFINNDLEYLCSGAFSRKYTTFVAKTKIVKWHNYKRLDWITVRRDDDKLYKFKEGDLKRLRIQDIEKMLLLLKLNLTKPDTYRSDLKRKEAYTAYSNLRGFIYQNKDKQNRLMRIDELHKFIDGTLNVVRTALDDRLKGIQMKYSPQTI